MNARGPGRWRPFVLAAAWLLLGVAARGHEIRQMQVSHEDGRYHIRATAWLDTPRAVVWQRLNAFDDLASISTSIEESRRLTAPTDAVIDVYTRSRYCVAFFCKTLHNVERITYPSAWRIRADVLAAHSDLAYGLTRWRLEAQDAGTLVHYRSDLEPLFKLPPLLGPALLERVMRAQFTQTITGLERRD